MRKRVGNDVIAFIIRKIMKDKKEIETQKLLLEAVKHELEKSGYYGVSTSRLRKVIADMSEIGIAVKSIKGNVPMKCPVCSHSLKNIYIKNLEGKKILVAKRCRRCGYKGGNGKWRVGRYIFYLKE